MELISIGRNGWLSFELSGLLKRQLEKDTTELRVAVGIARPPQKDALRPLVANWVDCWRSPPHKKGNFAIHFNCFHCFAMAEREHDPTYDDIPSDEDILSDDEDFPFDDPDDDDPDDDDIEEDIELPDCGTLFEQTERFKKYSSLLRQYEANGFAPDELLSNFEELRKAHSQFYSAWVSASVDFDTLLEAGGTGISGTTMDQRNRMTFWFPKSMKRQAKNLWQKTCSLYDDFLQISRVSFETWGIYLDYDDVPYEDFHGEHIDRQFSRTKGDTVYIVS